MMAGIVFCVMLSVTGVVFGAEKQEKQEKLMLTADKEGEVRKKWNNYQKDRVKYVAVVAFLCYVSYRLDKLPEGIMHFFDTHLPGRFVS